MKHGQARIALQEHITPTRAACWFVRGTIFALGWFDANGQRHLLARGDRGRRGTERTLREAIAEWGRILQQATR